MKPGNRLCPGFKLTGAREWCQFLQKRAFFWQIRGRQDLQASSMCEEAF